jgi:hypothetical protein
MKNDILPNKINEMHKLNMVRNRLLTTRFSNPARPACRPPLAWDFAALMSQPTYDLRTQTILAKKDRQRHMAMADRPVIYNITCLEAGTIADIL